MIDSADLRVEQEERSYPTTIRPFSVTIQRNPSGLFAKLILSGKYFFYQRRIVVYCDGWREGVQ